MKIKELIGESSPEIHLLRDSEYRMWVKLELDDKTLMFFMPHGRFNLDREVTPVHYHKQSGRVFPITEISFSEVYDNLPIVYIED